MCKIYLFFCVIENSMTDFVSFPSCWLKGMLLDVRKVHAWGYCWTKEMHGWVLGLLEGVWLIIIFLYHSFTISVSWVSVNCFVTIILYFNNSFIILNCQKTFFAGVFNQGLVWRWSSCFSRWKRWPYALCMGQWTLKFSFGMTTSLFLVDVRCYILFVYGFCFWSYYSCYVTLVLILEFILLLKPETINKMLVNQMLLCFGIMFASQVRGSGVWHDICLSMF